MTEPTKKKSICGCSMCEFHTTAYEIAVERGDIVDEPSAGAVQTRQTTTSELGELPRAVQNGMSQEEHDTWMFLSDKKALDEPYTFAVKQSDLTKFLQGYILKSKVIEAINHIENPYFVESNDQLTDIQRVLKASAHAFDQAILEIRQTLNLLEENINE
mgnify:CR=1 FL=1